MASIANLEPGRSTLSAEAEAAAAAVLAWPPTVGISWCDEGASAPRRAKLLIVGVRAAGSLFCRCAMANASVVGGVALGAAVEATTAWPATLADAAPAAPNARGAGWTCVIAEPTPGVLVVVGCCAIEASEGHGLWSAIARAIEAERVVVFDAQHAGTFAAAPGVPPSAIHCVATDALRAAAAAAAAEESSLAYRAARPICPLLRCPNALVGFAATVLTHAQASGVPAAAFVALQSQPTGRLAPPDAPATAAFVPALRQAALAVADDADPAWCVVDEEGVKARYLDTVGSVAPTASCSHLYS